MVKVFGRRTTHARDKKYNIKTCTRRKYDNQPRRTRCRWKDNVDMLYKEKWYEGYELDPFGSKYVPLAKSFEGHYEIPGKVASAEYSMYLSS